MAYEKCLLQSSVLARRDSTEACQAEPLLRSLGQ